MEGEQFRRIISAIDYTLEQLRRGPKDKDDKETIRNYELRVESWYKCKFKFCLYAVRCLKSVDKNRAEGYLTDLRQLQDVI